jgi:hypothetical protein
MFLKLIRSELQDGARGFRRNHNNYVKTASGIIPLPPPPPAVRLGGVVSPQPIGKLWGGDPRKGRHCTVERDTTVECRVADTDPHFIFRSWIQIRNVKRWIWIRIKIKTEPWRTVDVHNGGLEV